jgi:hypothetical protein
VSRTPFLASKSSPDHDRDVSGGTPRKSSSEFFRALGEPALGALPVPDGTSDGEQVAGLYKSRFGRIEVKATVCESVFRSN